LRDDLRSLLGLPRERRLVLASFGGYGVEGIALEALDCTAEWEVVLTAPDAAAEARIGARRGVSVIPEPALYGTGLRYHDLVKAVDVVVTKPGYGIISDCIANGTALLYTSRGRFAEYDVLVAEMPRYLRCGFIEGDDLRQGRWRAALDAVWSSPPPPETPRVDGAAVAAEMIAGYL
jgi:L-arabinokinase